jgi:hypothetical protein
VPSINVVLTQNTLLMGQHSSYMDPLLYIMPLFSTFQDWAGFFIRTLTVKAQRKAFLNLHVLPFLLTPQFENVFLALGTSPHSTHSFKKWTGE